MRKHPSRFLSIVMLLLLTLLATACKSSPSANNPPNTASNSILNVENPNYKSYTVEYHDTTQKTTLGEVLSNGDTFTIGADTPFGMKLDAAIQTGSVYSYQLGQKGMTFLGLPDLVQFKDIQEPFQETLFFSEKDGLYRGNYFIELYKPIDYEAVKKTYIEILSSIFDTYPNAVEGGKEIMDTLKSKDFSQEDVEINWMGADGDSYLRVTSFKQSHIVIDIGLKSKTTP
jgi:hypothetical protein